MTVNEVETYPPVDRPVEVASRGAGAYSQWLVPALGAVYIAALAALIFLPGDTLLARLRALDGGICAQAGTHSYWPGGQQLPLCSRNTGIYLGFALTFFTLLALGRLRAVRFPGAWVAIILALAVIFMAEDGFNSFLLDLGLPHLYHPDNRLRLASGLGTGVAMCVFLVPVANTLIWREEGDHSTFRTPRQLALMLPILLLGFLAVASPSGLVLYPVALLSTFGLVMALALVNTVFLLGLTNRVGRFATLRAFFPFFTLAVFFAVIELVALFALKTRVLHMLQTP